MNTKKKITADTAKDDFKKVMTFHVVSRIDYFFRPVRIKRKKYYHIKYTPPDYMAFWNARDEFGKFKENLRKYGLQNEEYTHRVYSDLEHFDKCGFPPEAMEAIFRRISNYSKCIKHYKRAKHGTLRVHDELKQRKVIHYPTIYSPDLDELRDIFKSRENFEKVMNLWSGYYTARQIHIILVYILKQSKFKKCPGKRRGGVKTPATLEDIRKAVGKQVKETYGEDKTSCKPPPPEEAVMDEQEDLLDSIINNTEDVQKAGD